MVETPDKITDLKMTRQRQNHSTANDAFKLLFPGAQSSLTAVSAALREKQILSVLSRFTKLPFLTAIVMCASYAAAAQTTDLNVKLKSSDTKASVEQMQTDFLKLKFGLFIHFGLQTFNNGEKIAGYRNPAEFNPGGPIDTDAWADAAKAAGMKYAVLTAKHNTGFCLWDSAYTTYDVMNPQCPYKQDLVAQFIKSFTSRGLKVGLYYNWRNPGFGDPNKTKDLPPECDPATHSFAEQIEFQKKQVTELLSKYPDVFYLWNDAFDSRVMPAEEMLQFIRSVRPNVIASSNWFSWGKKGTPYLDIAVTEKKDFPADNVAPGETCAHLQGGWFWSEGSHPVGSTEGIVKRINLVNSRHANFLLNVAPDTKGNFPADCIKRLADVGKLLSEDAANHTPNAQPNKGVNP